MVANEQLAVLGRECPSLKDLLTRAKQDNLCLKLEDASTRRLEIVIPQTDYAIVLDYGTEMFVIPHMLILPYGGKTAYTLSKKKKRKKKYLNSYFGVNVTSSTLFLPGAMYTVVTES